MIKNLLLVALRNFKRDKWYSLTLKAALANPIKSLRSE